MEGIFYEQVKEEVMKDVDKRVSDEVSGLYKVIDNLKARYTGALIATGLVASLIGGIVGYVLNDRLKKEIIDLDTKVSLIYLESTTPSNQILSDSVVNGNSVITNPSKSISDEITDFSGKRLIQPVPVPGSSKQLGSSFEGY